MFPCRPALVRTPARRSARRSDQVATVAGQRGNDDVERGGRVAAEALGPGEALGGRDKLEEPPGQPCVISSGRDEGPHDRRIDAVGVRRACGHVGPLGIGEPAEDVIEA